MPKAYVLDMFPYPSGAGLHVGHPEGYTATDIVSRYQRMRGFNVLHPMGWDAFGLPAEQYAIKTEHAPADHDRRRTSTTSAGRSRCSGFSYDWDREVDTTDPSYYKWTQWIFLQLFNSYFDPIDQKAKPIAHLINELVNENLVVAPDGTSTSTRRRRGWSDRRRGARRAAVARAVAGRAARRHRRPAAGVHGRGAGELVPGAGHGAGQRGGRSTARARSAGFPSSGGRCGSGCCASRPTPTGCSRTWSCSTGRSR